MLSVDQCWAFLESQVGGSAALPPGASASAISKAEATMRVKFPADLRKLLLRHDGSGKYFISPYKIGGGGQTFMALKDIIGTWKCMVDIGADFENQGEFGEQKGPIKQNYWNKRWIPFTENGCGDNIVIDLDPPDEGTLGQVVDWWHEGGVSTFQSSSLRDWLNEVVDEIKKGVYTFGST
jgi:cell wall assembly regulator SMI1